MAFSVPAGSASGALKVRSMRSASPANANVRVGVSYLAELMERYGDVSLALAAYNWGPTRIAQRLRRGEPVPVLYSRRVFAVWRPRGERRL